MDKDAADDIRELRRAVQIIAVLVFVLVVIAALVAFGVVTVDVKATR